MNHSQQFIMACLAVSTTAAWIPACTSSEPREITVATDAGDANDDIDSAPVADAPDGAGPACWWQRLTDSSSSHTAPAPLGVAVGPGGTVVLAGAFQGSLNLAGQSFAGAEGTNLYLVKLNPEGQIIWARTYPIAVHSSGMSVAVGDHGAIALAGTYHGSGDLGSGPLGYPDGPGVTPVRIFIAVFLDSGAPVWSRTIGAERSWLAGVTVGPDDRVALAGHVAEAVDTGSGLHALSASGVDSFVSQYDANGEPTVSAWFPGVALLSLAADRDDGSYLAGQGLFDADAGATGDDRALIAFLNSDGTVRWGSTFGDTAYEMDSSPSVSRVASSGTRAWFAGDYPTAIDLGGGPLLANSPCSPKLFIASFSDAGQHLASRGLSYVEPCDIAGGGPTLALSGLATGPSGRAIVAGHFGYTIKFGDAPEDAVAPKGVYSVEAAGSKDIFLASFDKDAHHLWTKGFGAPGTRQQAWGLATGPDGSITLTGSYWNGPLDLGCGELPPEGGGFVIHYPPGFFE